MTVDDFRRELMLIAFESGMTYKEISEKSGLAHGSVAAWTRGKRNPRLDTAIDVLKVLGYKLEIVKDD